MGATGYGNTVRHDETDQREQGDGADRARGRRRGQDGGPGDAAPGRLLPGPQAGIEGLVGAVLLDFLSLSDGEQEARLRRLLPQVEALFASDGNDLVEGGPAEKPADEGGSVGRDVAIESRPMGQSAPKKRRDIV